jgi:hypothetical protein
VATCSRAARRAALALALVLPLPLACTKKAVDLPTPEAARAAYAANVGVRDVALNGNVVEFSIRQPTSELQHGGSLWARLGPYVYLFSPGTEHLFDEYQDLAGVRVTTIGPSGQWVARALLPRDTMSSVLWQRSLNILGHALQEGTTNPRRLEELIDWGEQHTRYQYNPKFLPR